MDKYILSLLFYELNTIMSWGFSNPMTVNNGLLFQVNGFKHTGFVFIKYNEGTDLFDLELFNRDNSIAESIEGVYAEDLVFTIDNEVEKTDHYREDVQRWVSRL